MNYVRRCSSTTRHRDMNRKRYSNLLGVQFKKPGWDNAEKRRGWRQVPERVYSKIRDRDGVEKITMTVLRSCPPPITTIWSVVAGEKQLWTIANKVEEKRVAFFKVFPRVPRCPNMRYLESHLDILLRIKQKRTVANTACNLNIIEHSRKGVWEIYLEYEKKES